MEPPLRSSLRWMATSESIAAITSLSSISSRGSSDSTSPSSGESTISESFSVSLGSSKATTLPVSRAPCCGSGVLRSRLCSRARFSTTPSFASSTEGELLDADGGPRICCGKGVILSLVVVELVLCPRRGPPSVVLILALVPAFQVIVGVWPAEETGEPRAFLDATAETGSSKSSSGLLRSNATVRESGFSAIGGAQIIEM